MTGPFGALTSLFVAPPVVTPGVALPAELAAGDADARHRRPQRPGARRPSKRRRSPRSAGAVSTAVVGDAGAGAFAVDLAVALATRDGARCAVVAVWGAGAVTPPRGHPTRAADRVLARLTTAGVEPLAAGGRGVVVTLPESAAAAADVVKELGAAAGENVTVVAVLCGARPAAFDGALAGCRQIVLAVAATAPPALAAVAVASVGGVAPAARVVPVILGTGPALPRPLRHRTAIRRVLAGDPS